LIYRLATHEKDDFSMTMTNPAFRRNPAFKDKANMSAEDKAKGAKREADAQRAPSQAALRAAEAKLAQIEARIQALRQIQERAQSQERVGPWLGKHGLSSLGRLWQKLRIEEGWETALESVLRERVEALEVGQLEHVAALSADTPPGKVSFFSPRATGPVATPGLAGSRPLLEVVRSTDASLHLLLGDWLSGWFVAESVEQAMADRERLPPGGRFVTPEGHAVGRHSLQMYARDSEREGVLARQHELDHLGRRDGWRVRARAVHRPHP
jgi:chromosome segregation protein